ncbi:oxidoreductase [Afipia sp. Root123D2]|uniref:NAD(P)H-dependent flavin oxidoreductase n=1 Tax=Afipia sp. Root123D2 TaxID=1736436 RepID=UPI0006F4CEA0|nr:nitronate monooxygenase [Afipia sp. Root123D2]KQW23254.1 oxidoreductase [Afipia sp. Root123D2]
MISTALTQLFDLRAPILSAPMAGIAGGALAAAVTRAGGLGVIGGGYGDRDWLKSQLAAAGNTPVGVGFITWSMAKRPDLLKLALDHAPKAIFLSFGDLRPFAPLVKQAGIPLIAQVQTLRDAKVARDEGADVIVAQGTEAGGHGSIRSTFTLVPEVVDAVGLVPVVAAGGVADGRGLAAALMLGAAGVLCGTAFVTSEETLLHPNVKAAAVAATGDDTLRSSVFDVARSIDWPEPWTMRTLRNAFSDQWADDFDGLRSNAAREAARYAKARDAGDTDVSAVIVGEGIGLIHAVQPAAQVVQRIVDQAEKLLAR